MTSADPAQLQAVLEETNIPQRLMLTLELLKKELAICMLQQKLGKEVKLFIFASDNKDRFCYIIASPGVDWHCHSMPQEEQALK